MREEREEQGRFFSLFCCLPLFCYLFSLQQQEAQVGSIRGRGFQEGISSIGREDRRLLFVPEEHMVNKGSRVYHCGVQERAQRNQVAPAPVSETAVD